MKNKREDRFEAIVDQFVKSIIEWHIVKGDIVYSRISNYIFTIKNRMARDTCENENKMFLLFVTVIFKWNLCKKTGSSFD